MEYDSYDHVLGKITSYFWLKLNVSILISFKHCVFNVSGADLGFKFVIQVGVVRVQYQTIRSSLILLIKPELPVGAPWYFVIAQLFDTNLSEMEFFNCFRPEFDLFIGRQG